MGVGWAGEVAEAEAEAAAAAEVSTVTHRHTQRAARQQRRCAGAQRERERERENTHQRDPSALALDPRRQGDLATLHPVALPGANDSHALTLNEHAELLGVRG